MRQLDEFLVEARCRIKEKLIDARDAGKRSKATGASSLIVTALHVRGTCHQGTAFFTKDGTEAHTKKNTKQNGTVPLDRLKSAEFQAPT